MLFGVISVAKEEAEGLWSLGQALHPQEVQKTVGVREGIIGQGDEEARERAQLWQRAR